MTSRWSALALLFCAAVLNLLDRQIVGILAEQIKTDLSLSDTRLGLLTGTAFGTMYAVFTIPMSRLSDYVSRTRLVAVAISIWSALTVCCGLTANFGQLVLTRMGVGIGEAGSQSASASVIVDYFPPRQHGLAMAIFYLGVPVGGCLGLLLGAWVGSWLGWRNAFVVAGAPGVLLGILIWTGLRDPRAPKAGNHATDLTRVMFSLGIGRAIRRLTAIPSYRLMVIGSIAGASFQYLAAAWLPVYFVRVQGMSMVETALWMSIALAVGGTIGSVAGGWACDRLRSHVRQPESLILAISYVMVCPLLAVTCLASNKVTAIIGLLITYPFAFTFLTPATLLVQRAAPEDLRGIAVGLWASVMNVVSLTLVMPLIGWGSDTFTSVYGARGLAYSLACSALLMLAGACMFALAGRALNAPKS